MVSGFAFNDDDFLKPWEGWKTNLERYIFPNTEQLLKKTFLTAHSSVVFFYALVL
jgi:hypothetical protein